MRDLRAGGRHEVAEHACGRVLLGRRERAERALEVVFDHLLSSTQPAQGVERQRAGAGCLLDLPQPLHHELQVGGLDGLGRSRLGGPTPARLPVVEHACLDLSEHGIDERRLDFDSLVGRGKLVVDAHGPDDRRAAGLAVESLEPQPVREQVRELRLEDVERRQRLLPQREQAVDAQTGPQQLRELPHEAVLVTDDAVVDEVLLRLVEDQVEVKSELLRPGGEVVCERSVTRRAPRTAEELGLDRCSELGDHVSAPGAEDHDRELTRPTRLDILPVELQQLVRDPGAQQRALPYATRPVQDRQPGREQVGRDDLPLALAPEEQHRVERRVFEGREALERRRRQWRRPGQAWAACDTGRCAASTSTYCSSGSSTTSTSRLRQNSRSSGVGSGCTAHER